MFLILFFFCNFSLFAIYCFYVAACWRRRFMQILCFVINLCGRMNEMRVFGRWVRFQCWNWIEIYWRSVRFGGKYPNWSWRIRDSLEDTVRKESESQLGNRFKTHQNSKFLEYPVSIEIQKFSNSSAEISIVISFWIKMTSRGCH